MVFDFFFLFNIGGERFVILGSHATHSVQIVLFINNLRLLYINLDLVKI